MPANYDMSWEPGPRRWKRMESGVVYKISVRQLRKHFGDPSIPDTKDGSRAWANRWWRERTGSPHGSEPTRKMETYDLDTGEPTGVFMEVTQSEIDYQIARREELRRGLSALLNSGPAPPERTVGTQVDRYLDLQLTRHRAGQISVCTYDNLRHDLNAFRGWLGSGTAIDSIDANRWESWWRHLMTATLPIDTKPKLNAGALLHGDERRSARPRSLAPKKQTHHEHLRQQEGGPRGRGKAGPSRRHDHRQEREDWAIAQS
jgi:hypothetical protein